MTRKGTASVNGGTESAGFFKAPVRDCLPFFYTPTMSDSPAVLTETPQAEPPAEFTGIRVGDPKHHAAGVTAVASSLKHVFGQAGVSRGIRGMAKLNQANGFDCPSCAWPDPDDHRAVTEFCENGAKALASETTKRRVDPG